MPRPFVAILAAAISSVAFAQVTPQPPPTPPPAPTQPVPQPGPGGKPAIRQVNPSAVPSVTPATQPPALPVPDGPALNHQELEDGLIVEDIKIGTGYELKAGAVALAHYHGTFKADGKEFDSTYKRSQPVAFPLNSMIPGWRAGVPGMKVGGIRRLIVPSKLAYGEAGRPGIPPNSDLVFIIQIENSLQIETITPGEGDPATQYCVAALAYKLVEQGDKEVETFKASSPFILIPNEFQPLQLAIEGLKPGGKRRIFVPKEMNNVPAQAPSIRPINVDVTYEVELLFCRNLPQRR